jgi:SDR family mycofactocin-dependent oxidoreductase
MGLLEGKVAFITGAARGQGRAHALASAREGADVVLVDIAAQVETVDYVTARDADLDETAELVEKLGQRVVSVKADVRSQEQLDGAVSRAIAELGQIDILIANAGIWNRAPFWEMSERVWSDLLDINLNGVWRAAKAVAPHMIERQSGSIVVISSVNGLEPGHNYAHYVAAKHGLIGLMKSMALELGPHGVRCNAISPGIILTPMTNHQAAWDLISGHSGGTEQEMLEGGYHFGVLKGTTFLAPDTIANTAVYLNSDLAASVTGVTIPVDAGHMLLPGFNHAPIR